MNGSPSIEGHRVVAVTGAGSGLGRAVTEALLAAGTDVALLDRDREAIQRLADDLRGVLPGHPLAVPCDITDRLSVEEGFGRVGTELGRLDGLVNSAGVAIPNPSDLVEDVTDEDWALALGVNLTGTFICCRAAIPMMAASGGGSVINIASTAALVHEPGLEAYSAAKGGVVALTRALVPSSARRGVRLNVVCPGLLRTPMTNQVASTLLDHLEAGTLLEIPGPEAVVGIVDYLLSPASTYMTGSVLVIDGGFTAQ